MENQKELEELKKQATEQGVQFSPNIGIDTLKKRVGLEEEANQKEDEEANFEKNCVRYFNELISKEKDAYNDLFDIKKAKFVFWFTKKNNVFADRFARSLVQWVKTNNLSIDKLTESDISFTEKSITIFPTRSPKPLSKRQKDILEQKRLKREGY